MEDNHKNKESKGYNESLYKMDVETLIKKLKGDK